MSDLELKVQPGQARHDGGVEITAKIKLRAQQPAILALSHHSEAVPSLSSGKIPASDGLEQEAVHRLVPEERERAWRGKRSTC